MALVLQKISEYGNTWKDREMERQRKYRLQQAELKRQRKTNWYKQETKRAGKKRY